MFLMSLLQCVIHVTFAVSAIYSVPVTGAVFTKFCLPSLVLQQVMKKGLDIIVLYHEVDHIWAIPTNIMCSLV